MIFVTVGNHYQGFDRLVRKVDEIASRISQEVIIQRGYTQYKPQNTKFFDFVPVKEAMSYIQNAELVISHAGIGTIILCKEYGTPIIIVPRRKRFSEHGTDHQLEIAKALEDRKEKNVYVLYDERELEAKIKEILSMTKRRAPKPNIGRLKLITTIREFIENNIS